MNLTFPEVCPAEAELLIVLIEKLYVYEEIPFDRNDVSRPVSQLLATPSLGWASFIRADDKVVGYFIVTYGFDIEFGGRDALITDLYLIPDFRKKGLGTLALNFIRDACRLKGVHAVHLHVERDNEEAQRTYQKFGFGKADRYPMTFRL